eukprot:XP_002259367.1 hypothetical protein, conserved in Plasmodium species [Plasmodium knowlesi strain H]
MKGIASRSGSINLYDNITDSLSKLKTIIKYDQKNDMDKGGGEAQQGKAHEGGHCKLAKDGPNDEAKYRFLCRTETTNGDPSHRQKRDERKSHRTNNEEKELLRSIAKANSLKKIEKNISLLLRSDDEEGDVEEEKEEHHYDRSDECVAVEPGTVFTSLHDYDQREVCLPKQPHPSIVQTDGEIRRKNCDEAIEMDRDVNYRVNANSKMVGGLGGLEKIPHFSSTGNEDRICYSKDLVQSGYANMVDTDMAHSTDGPSWKKQLDLSFLTTEDLKKEFSFYSLSEKNSVHKFSLHNNDMLDLSQISNFSKFSNFSNGLRGSRRSHFAKGSKPKEAPMSDSNTSISSFTFNGNSSNIIGRNLEGENESDRRNHHGEHGINSAIALNSDHSAKIQGRVFSTTPNGIYNKGFSKQKKSDTYIAVDNTSSNSGTYYENSLKSNRSNLGTSRQNTLDESHRTYLGSGDFFDPNLTQTKVDRNALPGQVIFHTKNIEMNESLHNINANGTNPNGNSSWIKSGERASLKNSGTYMRRNYLIQNNSNDVELAHSQMSAGVKEITTDHVMDHGAKEKRKENVHLGLNIDFDNNIFKNYNKEKKLEEGKKCGSDVEGRLPSEEGMSEVLTHAASSGKAPVKDEADGTLPISEDDVDRKNINEIYKKINSISMLNDLSLNKLESLNSSIMDIYTKNNDEGKFLDDVILDDSIFIKSNTLYGEEGSPHAATAQADLPPEEYRKRFSFSSDPDVADSLFKISLSCNEVVLPTCEASRSRGETESTHSNRPKVEEAKTQPPPIVGHTPSNECEVKTTDCQFKQRGEARETSKFRETIEEQSQRRSNSINHLKDKYSKRKDDTMENEMKLFESPSQLDKNSLLKNTLTLQRSYNNMEWRKYKTTTLDQFRTPSTDYLLSGKDQMEKSIFSRSSVNKTDSINSSSKQGMYKHDDRLSKNEVDNLPNLFLNKSVFSKCADMVSKTSDMNNTLKKSYDEDASDDPHACPSRGNDIRSDLNSFSISNYSCLTGKTNKRDQIKQANSFSSVFPHDDKANNGDPSHCFRGGTNGGMRRKRSISDCEGKSANAYNDSSVDKIHGDNANGLRDSSAYDTLETKWAIGGNRPEAQCTDGESVSCRNNMLIGASGSSMQWSRQGEVIWSKTKEARGSSTESRGVPNELDISKRASHCAVNHLSGSCAEDGAGFIPHRNEDTTHMRNLSYDGAVINGKMRQSQNDNPRFLRQLSRGTDCEESSSVMRSNGKEVRPNEGKFCPLDKNTTLEGEEVSPMMNNKNVDGINYTSQRSKDDDIKHSGMTSMGDIIHFSQNNSSIFFFDNIHNSSEYDCIPKPLHSSYFENKRKISREGKELIEEDQTTFQSNGNTFERITKGNVCRTSPLSDGNSLITRPSMNECLRYPSGEKEKHFEKNIMRPGTIQRKMSNEGVPDRQGYPTNQTTSWRGLQRSSSSVLVSGSSGNITPSVGFVDDPTVKENTHDDGNSGVGVVIVEQGVQQKGHTDQSTTTRSDETNERSFEQVQFQKGMEQSREKGKAEDKASCDAPGEGANDVLETCSTSYSFEKSERSGINEQKREEGKSYQYVLKEDYQICEPAQRGGRSVATEYASINVERGNVADENIGGANGEKSNTRKVAIPPREEERRKMHPNSYDEGKNNRRTSPCSGQGRNTFPGESKCVNGYTGRKESTNGSRPNSMSNDVHENSEIRKEHQSNDNEEVSSGKSVYANMHLRSGSKRDDHSNPRYFNNKPSVDYQVMQDPGGKTTDYMGRQNHEETSRRNTQYTKNSNASYGNPYRCNSGHAGYMKQGGHIYEHASDECETFLSQCGEENYTSHKGNISDYPQGRYFSKGKWGDEFYPNHYNEEVRNKGEISRGGALSEDTYLGAVNLEVVEQNRSESRSGRCMHQKDEKDEHGNGFQSEKNSMRDKNAYERNDSLNTIQPYRVNHPREEGERKISAHNCGNGRCSHPSNIHTEGYGRKNIKDMDLKKSNEIIMAPDRLQNVTDSTNLERMKGRNTYDYAGENFPQERPIQDYPYGRCQSREGNYTNEQFRKGDNCPGRPIVEMVPSRSYELKTDEQFEGAMIQHKYRKNGTQHYEDETSQPTYPFTEMLPNDKVHSGHLGSLSREEQFVKRLMEGNVRDRYNSLGGCEGYENWSQREGGIVEGDKERYGPSWNRDGEYQRGEPCGNYHGEKRYGSHHHPLYENLDEHSAMVSPPNRVEKSKTNVKIVDHNYSSVGNPYGTDFYGPVMPDGAYVKAHTSYVAYGGGWKWKDSSTQPVGCAHVEGKKETIYNYKEAHLKCDMVGEIHEGKNMGSQDYYEQCLHVDGRSDTALPHDYYFDEGALREGALREGARREGARREGVQREVVRRYSKYAQEELHRKGENVTMLHPSGVSRDVDSHMGRVVPAPSCQYSGNNSGGPVALHYDVKREDNTHGLTPQIGDDYPNENKTWNCREGKNELPFRKANTNYEYYKVARDMGTNLDGRIFRHSDGDTIHRGGMSRGNYQVDHNTSSTSGKDANYNELLYELFRENIDSQGKEKNTQVLNKIMEVMMNIQNDLKDMKCKLIRKKKNDSPGGGDAPSEDSGEPKGQRDHPCNRRSNERCGREGESGEGKSGEGEIGEGVIGEGVIGEGVIGEGVIGEGEIGERKGQSKCLDSSPDERSSSLNNREQDANLTPVLKNLNYEDVKDSAMSKSNRLYLFSKFFTSVFSEKNMKTHNFIMFNIYNTDQKRQTHKVSLFLERDYNDIYSLAYNNLLFYSFDCYNFYKYIKSKFQGSYKIYENSTLCLYIQNNYETNLINRLFIEQNNLHKSRFHLNEKRILKTCTKYVVESFLSLLDKQVNIKNVIPFMKKRNYEIDQKNLYFFISRFNLMDKIFSDSHGFECNKKSFEKFSPNMRNFAIFFKYIRDASNFYDMLVGAEAPQEATSEPGCPTHPTNDAPTTDYAPSNHTYRLIIVALHKGKSFHYDKAPMSSFIKSGQSDMHQYYNNYDSMSFSNDEVVLFNLSYAVPFYYIEYYRD